MLSKESNLRRPSYMDAGVICAGDRIYACLTRNGDKIVEFFIEAARDISDVVSAVMQHVGTGLGLTRLYVRNMSQGWSRERQFLIR